MITSPTGSRGIRVARARRLDGWGFIRARARIPDDDRRRPAGRLDIAKLVLGGDRARADQLDPVPGNPVRRLASQSLDPEAFVHAGGPVDRPRRAQIRETSRCATPRPRSRPHRVRPAARAPRAPPAAGARFPAHGPATAPRRSGASPSPGKPGRAAPWGSSIASKITRRYWGGVVGMIGASSAKRCSRNRSGNHRVVVSGQRLKRWETQCV